MGNLTLFTARDAKTRFGEVLDAALGEPVGITRHDRLTAYIISARDYERLIDQLSELEDQILLWEARAARMDGFASNTDVEALLSKLGNAGNESKNDQQGSQITR